MQRTKRSILIYQLKEAFVPVGYIKAPYLFTNAQSNVDNMAANIVSQGHPDPYVNVEQGIDLSAYEHVHTWNSAKLSHTEILTDTFRKFQHLDESPKGYKGRSVSVSDIVVIDEQAYLCRIGGWLKVELRQPNGSVEDSVHA